MHKVGNYVLFTQQDRKRSLFAFFSLRNLVSTRIQIGNQKEVIDHSRPGLLFPLIHVVWVKDSIIHPKLNVSTRFYVLGSVISKSVFRYRKVPFYSTNIDNVSF